MGKDQSLLGVALAGSLVLLDSFSGPFGDGDESAGELPLATEDFRA